MKINLLDPRIRKVADIFAAQNKKALQISQRIVDAVLPIYWTLRSPNKPEQIGSGVVVQIKGQYFIFTASHIFDQIGDFQLLIAIGDGKPLEAFSGTRFSTPVGKSGTHCDDPIDASVFHIQSSIPDELKRIALSLSDLHRSLPDDERSIYLAAGYRSKVSKTIGKQTYTNREQFPTLEYGDPEYLQLGVDKNSHLALAYEDQIFEDGKWRMSPKPQGLSGGAMVKASGVPIFRSQQLSREVVTKPLLAAITIAFRREHAGRPGVLIGTRIEIHLSLIDRYLPDLLDKQQATHYQL